MATSSITPSAAGLRTLSHPTRLRMLMLLRLEGPATATQLAQQLKLNTGATSYHLRQLAEHGFIVEDTERGDGRDRWWKAGHQSTRANLTARSEDEDETTEAYLQTVALMYTETLMQAVSERRYLPPAVAGGEHHQRLAPAADRPPVRSSSSTRWPSWSTAGAEEDDADTPGVGTFVVNLNAFPRPGTVVLEGDER